jgi:hypothetical protein
MTRPPADGRIAAVAAATLPRRLAAFILATAAILLLSSCLQMHLDVTVSTHDTISGQVRLGLQKSLLTALGGAGQLGQTLATQSSCDQAHANQSNYDDGTYVGVVCTYTDLPISQFGKGSRDPSSGLSLTRVGDEYKLAGSIDLTKLATNSANPGIPIDAATLLSSADVRLRFTFPGPITSSTGTVSGRTVTFTAGPSGKITGQGPHRQRTDLGVRARYRDRGGGGRPPDRAGRLGDSGSAQAPNCRHRPVAGPPGRRVGARIGRRPGRPAGRSQRLGLLADGSGLAAKPWRTSDLSRCEDVAAAVRLRCTAAVPQSRDTHSAARTR